MKQQKHKLIKRVLSVVLSLSMALCLIPSTVFAAEGNVAKIGNTEYATLDEAVEAATNGATIELLGDATTDGLNLHKDITIQAAAELTSKPTITFTKYGIAMGYGDKENGPELTFKNLNVIMTNIGMTPATGEWNWQTICATPGSILNLDNVNMTMDGENAQGANDSDGNPKAVYAMYFTGNNKLNLTNGTVLTIKNYEMNALTWDGGDGGYNVNITNSTYISDNNRSGFTGTFYATIDQSTVKVLNSTGNGSNGTYYTIKNGSNVVFNNNGSWGISAYRIDMTENSTLTAANNAYSGVWTRILNVDSSCTLDVENNGYGGSCNPENLGGANTGAMSNSGISFWGNSIASNIAEGATVTIKNNAGSGIATMQGISNLTIGSATITNNGSAGAKYGGGIFNVGTVSLSPNVVLYNNHASIAGDDIYNAPTATTRTFTFGKVGNKWALDGDPDCEHLIDGWYDDSEGTRWEAHADTEAGETNHIEEFSQFNEETSLATITGTTDVLALKAAHGIDAQDKTSYPGMDKVIVSNGEEVTNDSVAAGDTVNFKLESNVPDDLMNYINPDVYPPVVEPGKPGAQEPTESEGRGEYEITIHDQMDKAFVDMTAPVVMLDRAGDENDVTLENTNYTYTTETGDNCTFHIVIDLITLYENGIITDNDITNATPITVTYTATLNEDAAANSYKNTAWVTYPEGTSGKPVVTVDTYGITIFKYDSATNAGLEGAVFKLYDSNAEGAEPIRTGITSGADGYVTINGLDEGTYYLKETQAPNGYVCSDTPLEIVIPENANASNIVTVNFANTQIPHTGGMGTTLYTVGGAAIVAAAAVLFVVSRKKRQSK